MKNKTISLIIGMFILALLTVSFASAHFWACFDYGETVNYCSSIPGSKYHQNDTSCDSNPTCKLCMLNYYPNIDGGCYSHGSGNSCNDFSASCSNAGGETNFDFTPPVLTLSNPIKGDVYSDRKVLINASANESVKFQYQDNTRPGIWRNICTSSLTKNCLKETSFKEGLNNITIKATDASNNEGFYEVSFIIDSTSPRIYTTEPRANSFADGTFEVQFKEANPDKLTLYLNGIETANVDLNKCYESMGKNICTVDVELSNKYEGQTIGYYFEIEDIAGNKYKSRATNVKVDTKDPVVNNLNSFYPTSGRYVNFNISITEPNFYKVVALKTVGLRTTQTTLCTRLTNGFCVKKQSFLEGDYSLSIGIYDKAGHSIAIPANFNINY